MRLQGCVGCLPSSPKPPRPRYGVFQLAKWPGTTMPATLLDRPTDQQIEQTDQQMSMRGSTRQKQPEPTNPKCNAICSCIRLTCLVGQLKVERHCIYPLTERLGLRPPFCKARGAEMFALGMGGGIRPAHFEVDDDDHSRRKQILPGELWTRTKETAHATRKLTVL